MELSYPSVPAERWRTATLVAAGVAAVELLLLVVLGTALIGKGVSGAAKEAAIAHAAGPAAKIRPEPKRATLARGETSVVVLNGNGVAGAAAAEADRLKSRGYAIAATGNARRSDYSRTVVMYRPGRKPEAQRLARDLGIKLVGPLEGMSTRDLLGAHVAVILGS